MDILRVDLAQIVHQASGRALQLDVGQDGWRVQGLVVQVTVQDRVGEHRPLVGHLYPLVQFRKAALAEDRRRNVDQVAVRTAGAHYPSIVLDLAKEGFARNSGGVATRERHLAPPGSRLMKLVNFFKYRHYDLLRSRWQRVRKDRPSLAARVTRSVA